MCGKPGLLGSFSLVRQSHARSSLQHVVYHMSFHKSVFVNISHHYVNQPRYNYTSIQYVEHNDCHVCLSIHKPQYACLHLTKQQSALKVSTLNSTYNNYGLILILMLCEIKELLLDLMNHNKWRCCSPRRFRRDLIYHRACRALTKYVNKAIFYRKTIRQAESYKDIP